jgi:two-component system LytT family sensor kinase
MKKKKIILLQENANAEIQLLKAQLHPHFFFNTLNNIYSFILNQSSEGPKLIQKLSMLLKYISTHCDRAAVPLEKELQMIRDYINLEEIRYGDRLKMQIDINGNSDKILIAPLLLMPFVENSFKHGASYSLQKSFIKMYVTISDNLFKFYLENSIPLETKQGKERGKGIGLKNVQKRLALIYPSQHTLAISHTKDNFIVEMTIQFDKNSVSVKNNDEIQQLIFANSNLSYAN